MIPYIQLEGIGKWYGDFLLYEGLNLTVARGQRIALVAPNGAGKTTLLNLIAGTDAPDEGTVTFRKDVSRGFLRQEPELDSAQTLLEAVYHSDAPVAAATRRYEKALLHDPEDLEKAMGEMDALGAWDFERNVKAILTRLRLPDLDRKVGELSGGQRKRLALAMLLADDPEVLILDEPTNHLDLDMVEWLEDYLLKSNKTLLMVTHDRYFLDRVCTDIYEIDGKKLYTYRGGYHDYLVRREERLAQFEAEVDKARNLYRRELEWMRRMPQARGTKARYRKEAFYETQEKARQQRHEDSLDIRVRASRLGTKIFEAKGLSKRYGNKVILDDFSYTFNRYEKMGIIGENGSGKTTFLNLLTGSLPPDRGAVDVGESVRFGYYRQTGLSFDEGQKVIDVARSIAETVTLGDGKVVPVTQFLTRFLFPPEMQHAYVGKLSGGEKRRLYLLTVLMRSPNFLILDEPTNDLDILTLNVLESYLERFGGCLIVVSHDRYFMDKVVDHLLVFEGEGRIRDFPGNYTQYRNKLLEEKEAEAGNRPAVPRPAEEKRSHPERPRKMTFREKREYESLSGEIDALEAEKAALEAELSSGTLSAGELTARSERIGEVMRLLDEKGMRWLELSELE